MFLARFLYRKLKGYRFLIAFAIILTFAEVGTDILTPFPLKFILDKFTLENHPNPVFPGATALLGFFKQFNPQNNGVIAFSIAMIIALGLLGAIISYIQLYLASLIAKNLTVRLDQQLFDHLQFLPLSWHEQEQRQGDIVQRITGNIPDIEKFVSDGLVDMLAGTLTIVGIIAVMLLVNWQFTLLSFVIIPLLFATVLLYTRSIKAATKKEKKAEGEIGNVATEAMAEITEIKAFTLEDFMSSLFKGHLRDKLKHGMRAGSLQAQFTPLVTLLVAIGTAIITGIGAYVAAGQTFTLGVLTIPAQAVTFGTLILFISYLKQLYQPMRDLSKLTNLASSATSGAERIQEVLSQKPEDLLISRDSKEPARFEGTITYKHTFFSYKTGHQANFVLKDINLHIRAGRKVALVGLSGSGKTTLTKLIPRFYDLPDPYEVQQDWGSIEIDGLDIRKYPRSVIRQNIAVVFQDSILFEGSIRENIRLGRPNASEKELFQAAERACIHDTILRDLGGYDAKIINHGKNLSGGQRQRLAIARAILRDAPILILDEPTAALDVEAEAEVMRALDGLVEGRTVLMITHRLSTIGRVDEIVVFEYGRIAEQGTYQELKKQGGVFTRLLAAQNAYHFDPEESKSFIHSQFVSLSPLYPKAHVLIEVDGKTIGKCLLDKEVLTVGRIVENDVQVPSRLVSRLHAKILWKEGAWVIKDADSTNKLQYKGQIVDQLRFTHGDHIYLAPNVLLKYEEQGQAPAQELQPKLQEPILLPPSQLPLPQEQLPAPLFPKAQVLLEIDGKVVDTRLLDTVTLNVGRLVSNEIPVPSSPSTQLISRSHATILWENGTWVIKEQNNTNGLFYNGNRVRQHVFANGDRIFLAQTTVALRYELLP